MDKQALKQLGNDIIILGAIKCGQNSLVEYLKSLHPEGANVRRFECLYKGEEGHHYADKYPNAKCVIILRDNADRIWSSYHYFRYRDVMTLEEYLNLPLDAKDGHGARNPLVQGDYKHWIKAWEKYNPTVVWLEDMEKLEGFPHLNPTSRKNYEYPELDEKTRELINIRLSQYLNSLEEYHGSS